MIRNQASLHHTVSTDDMVRTASKAVAEGESALQDALEAIPAPIYVTDADGWVTCFNRACIDFAGRVPIPGQDRWCVTWRLYTEDGLPLPHDRCPMAVALKEQREVRGVIALAERPDGSRVMFTPYPTPVCDELGRVTGAVNILIDVTDERQSASLKTQAQRCRRLAQSVTDSRTVATLLDMAVEYEDKARSLGSRETA
jgi:PAS domain-containing protein